MAERTKIITALTKEAIDKIGLMYETAYEENRRVHSFYNMVSIELPEEMKFITSFVINKRFNEEITSLIEEELSNNKFDSLTKIMEMAENSQIKLKKEEVKLFLSAELENMLSLIRKKFKDQYISKCQNIFTIAKSIGLELDLSNSQVILFNYLTTQENLKNLKVKELAHLYKLAGNLNINTTSMKKKIGNLTTAEESNMEEVTP